MTFSMGVGCDCQHPEINYMDPEGIFEFDDGARGYAWICPQCGRRICVRLYNLDPEIPMGDE